MSYSDFLASPEGRLIAPLLEDEAMIREMIALSQRGRPAVEALDIRLAGRIALDNTQRQHVGRRIRDILEDRGWRTTIQRRLSNGRVFTSGTVYQRRAAPVAAANDSAAAAPGDGFAERLARARSIVRDGGRNDYGVDDFLADKHSDAAREAERP